MKANIFLLLIFLFIISCSKRDSSDIPLPEHPLPHFERSAWQNLNGYWQFRPDSTNVGLTENWQNEAEFFDQDIFYGDQLGGVPIGCVKVSKDHFV